MPALAIATALRELDATVEPVLVGAERGVEAKVLPTRDFRYHLLPAEPIYRRQWWKNVRWPVVALRLLRRIAALYREEQPVAVIGTGGYASGPVVYWAARAGLPVAIQEQNAYPGVTTRLLSPIARHVYLGLPEARPLLRAGSRTEFFDTGNPIPPPTPERRDSALRRFGITSDGPVILVTGGSQGALGINRAVAEWLDRITPGSSTLLWVTGRGTYGEFARYHRPPNVQVIDFLDPMADGYAVADVVVSRAGMMTVAELCAWGLPSVLVPLPTSAADHQTGNARVLAQAGAALFLPQAELSGDRLATEVARLLADGSRRMAMSAAARRRGRPQASHEIASKLLTLAG
jgi:UDP-N-acetylglucosamine--N-acetylmuramyl-(pentapeptide) pyrophosphoryl-undecaprenol N-acetylglucosamine transferase